MDWPELRTAGGSALVVLLLGAPLGLAWAAMAPHLDLQAVSTGSESAFQVQLTDDLVFLVLTGLAGLITGVAARLLGLPLRPPVVAGLLVGALAAGYVAASVGSLQRLPPLLEALSPTASAEQRGVLRFELRIPALVLAWPLLVGCTLLALRPPRPAASGSARVGWPDQVGWPAQFGRPDQFGE